MADSVDMPKDDGKIGLPRVDGAMIKTIPNALNKGTKGSKNDGKNSRLGQTKSKEKKEKLLEKIRKRFDSCTRSENESRKQQLEDLKFYDGNQWPEDIFRQRRGKPSLVLNRMPTFVNQVTNDLRMNRPSITISPNGDDGDKEVAKFYRGMIRAIEQQSRADLAYDNAMEDAARMGVGFWRITTCYEEPGADGIPSFNQDLRIEMLRNRFAVYLDPAHKLPDGSDSEYAFITEMMDRSEFKEKYPKADPMPWRTNGIGDRFQGWIEEARVRVAEYYEICKDTRDLVMLSNGHVGWKDELADDVKEMIADGRLEIEDEREAEIRKVKWYKVSATDILEEQETVFECIPIVKMIGTELLIEGKRNYFGVIRMAKDPQRMYNYFASRLTENVALAPKAKWIAEETQIEGHEDMWQNANTYNSPILLYKAANGPGGQAMPPPTRLAPEQADGSIHAILEGLSQDMMATTGIRFDATKQERMVDESGRAIRELHRMTDVGSYHYIDNFSRSLVHTGNILIQAIPKIYDTKRILMITREDGNKERVQVDPNAQQPMQDVRNPRNPNQRLKIFNPTIGKYQVAVDIGPPFATRRIEATESMMQFVKNVPQAAPLIMDLIAKNSDWPGSEQIEARLTKALPPNLLTPEQKDVPPQIQSLIQNQQQQIQQLQMQGQQMMKALQEKQSDLALRQDKIDKDFEAKLLQIVQKTEQANLQAQTQLQTSFQTHIAAEMRALGENVNLLMNSIQNPPTQEQAPPAEAP